MSLFKFKSGLIIQGTAFAYIVASGVACLFAVVSESGQGYRKMPLSPGGDYTIHTALKYISCQTHIVQCYIVILCILH